MFSHLTITKEYRISATHFAIHEQDPLVSPAQIKGGSTARHNAPPLAGVVI